MSQQGTTKIVKPKTKKGIRVQKDREPHLVETSKKVLLVHGNKPSQIVKGVLVDVHRLRPRETVRLSRKNDDIMPFEAGGEVKLEHFSRTADCGQFVFANHTKKRPNNLILGRFYNHQLFDLLELGVERHVPLQAFGSAGSQVQTDNKPCLIFAGEQFEQDTQLKQLKSIFVDLFRGQVVNGIDLLGLDHVIFVTAVEQKVFLRQYSIKLKKSGTKIPRVELKEMGPLLDVVIRRSRPANPELEKEALKVAVVAKKKEKNVNFDLLDGKVGRIYVPKQSLDSIPAPKLKGSKRRRTADQSVASKTQKLA